MGSKTALFARRQIGGAFVFTDETQTTGELFFVNSVTGTNVAGGGKNPDAPLASIAYALTLCTANKNDRIIAMPGHAESIAAAGSLACSVAGVSIIGLGNRFNRPVISFVGTDSVIAISGANATLKNVVLNAGVDEVVTAISVTAAGVTLDAVDVQEVTSKQFIQFLLTSALAKDITVQNCNHYQDTAPAANSLWIQLVGADRARIMDNNIQITTTNNASSCVIESDTTAPTDIRIGRNVIVQLGGGSVVPIKLVTSTSGYVHDNRVASTKTAVAGSIALASCYGAENYASNTVNTQGFLDPVVDT